ncbi:hypothetical protein ACJMK2_011176 [Sinanodonta woodiana]|uniref:Uncharacterized protein n=1 Tax=Sinanodonta woodiana TaxID=1069815 RepID=A0ABD3V5Y4_SINWO
METNTRFQVGPTVQSTDTHTIEQISEKQEKIIHSLQSVCRQLHNIEAKLGMWGRKHHSMNEECKIINCCCSAHRITCHCLSELRLDGCDTAKLTFELAQETEPTLPFSSLGSRDAQLQVVTGADETECRCPCNNQRLRDNISNITMEHHERMGVKFPLCDLGPLVATDQQETQNESISQNQTRVCLDDRYCLSKAIQKNLTLLLDVLPYRESELPDFLGEACLTDNENNRIRSIEQREDQIRLLLRTIMGRSFCDMKKFLDYARKFNPEEVDKVWKKYDDLKKEGNIEKRCIICLVMAHVDIKYVADVMYEKELIPDSLYGRTSDCKGSFGCQNRLWKELCRFFQHCNCKATLVETLINALEKKSKYRYLGEELRKCDRQVLTTLKCSCDTNQQRTKQTRPVLLARTRPRGSSSGTTSYSSWSSYSDISPRWNRSANNRRSSCLRRKIFAQVYKKSNSLHPNKRRPKVNTETATTNLSNSSNGMFEKYITQEYSETSCNYSLGSSNGVEMVRDGVTGYRVPSKEASFQDRITTTRYNNSRTCESQNSNDHGQAILPQGRQKLLPAFLDDVMQFSKQKKDTSVGEERNMTSGHIGKIQSNKNMSASTADTFSFRTTSSIPTFNRSESKHCQGSEEFCSANQCGEITQLELKTQTETAEEDNLYDSSRDTCTITNESESNLFDNEKRNSITKNENGSGEMLVTPVGQTRLQSKRLSLTRGLAIDRTERNMTNDSSETEETLSNLIESTTVILSGSINNDGSSSCARHLPK